jgi:hypothetical protein
MNKLKFTFLVLAAVAGITLNSPAQDAPAKSTNAPARPPAQKQADVASTTAKFGKIARTDAAYKSALDAHALDEASKLIGKEGAFKGSVKRIFELRGGTLDILNFDENYRNALTAVVQGANFSKFPALTNLIGKDVLITGNFTNYQGRAEIVLTNAEQIKLVE